MYINFRRKKYYVNNDEKEMDRSELNRQYKSLAKKIHPDAGGKDSDFKSMQEEYEACKKVIDTTKFADEKPGEIDKLIKRYHPDYPHHSDGWNAKLQNFYHYYYEFINDFENDFTGLELEEIKILRNLDIRPNLQLRGSNVNNRDISIFFASDRESINDDIKPIFQGLRMKLSNIYRGCKFSFIIKNNSNKIIFSSDWYRH